MPLTRSIRPRISRARKITRAASASGRLKQEGGDDHGGVVLPAAAGAPDRQPFGDDGAGRSDLDGDLLRGRARHDVVGDPGGRPEDGVPAAPRSERLTRRQQQAFQGVGETRELPLVGVAEEGRAGLGPGDAERAAVEREIGLEHLVLGVARQAHRLRQT